jgi:uncharacterized protein (TIGR02757 family)
VTRKLHDILDRLYESRSPRHLANDPLSFCHRYDDPRDREIAAVVASSLAYGRVSTILSNLEKVFSVMGPSPRRFVERFDVEDGLRLFSRFRHRFNDGRDLCALLLAARTMIEEADTVGEFFLAGYDGAAPDVTPALTAYTDAVLSIDYSPVFRGPIPVDSYFRFFFPSPASGSACKRLCMFLRWVVRPADGIDLGLWHEISPSKLVIPVDAHIRRIGKLLGLTKRNQADWRMAQEITESLRRFDRDDPVKYDFSLCHLGISEGCDGKNAEKCVACALAGACPGVS